MSEKKQHSTATSIAPIRRKTHLFPRNLRDVLNLATKNIVDKRGHVFAVLLKNWPEIIGSELASVCLLKDVKFPTKQAQKGVLHVQMPPHLLPELPYLTPSILEKCASYLGYHAIEKIVAQAANPDKTI